MSDLIVIGYPDEHRAHDVWAELVKLGHDYLVDLEDAAIIWRDENGKVHVTTPAHHAVAKGTVSGLFWGTLIGLLFMFPLAPLAGVAAGSWGRRWAPPGASASKTTSGSASRTWWPVRRLCLKRAVGAGQAAWCKANPGSCGGTREDVTELATSHGARITPCHVQTGGRG